MSDVALSATGAAFGYPQFAAKGHSRLKLALWTYVIILLFEGALRKWVLPGFAAPLLIVRDPIAIWILFEALRSNLFPVKISLLIMYFIALIATFTAVTVGHGNIAVAMYGARPFFLHFPLLFIFASAFTREDILKIGRFIIIISLPMTLLIILQFYSPQSAWVNRGVGGDIAGSGFSGALGYLRPSGTFSFANGLVFFYSIQAAFLFYFLINSNLIDKRILFLGAAALIMAMPTTISRTLFFQIVLTGFFAVATLSRKPKLLGRFLLAVILLSVAIAILSQVQYFQTSVLVFNARFDRANENEGGLEGVLIDRYLGGLISAIYDSADQSFWGQGIGLGTNVGSQLAVGAKQFLIAEGEWGRLVGEMGPVLGLATIIVRICITLDAAFKSIEKLHRGDILPWLILSVAVLFIPQAQWAQPTSLGFFTVIGGLLFASINDSTSRKTSKTNRYHTRMLRWQVNRN